MKISNLTNWLASRARNEYPPTTIVLHATDGASAGSSIAWLKQIGLSYHYVIERDGSITKCVPISRVAFHAGVSQGPNGSDVNPYSIGIAFANFESHGEKVTEAQVQAAKELCQALCLDNPRLRFLTTHYAISPGRKTDPANISRFDLGAIAGYAGLSLWGIKV